MTRILALLATALVFAASAWAQDADALYAEFRKLRDDKDAKPSQAYFQQLAQAAVNFLAVTPKFKNATRVVNDTLSYGTTQIAQKDKALRPAFYSLVQFAITHKMMEPDLPKDAKTSLTALKAAMVEGASLESLSTKTLVEWRQSINELADMPGSAGFQLDREKGYYNTLCRLQNVDKFIEAQLDELAKHKDRGISNWAKQEMKYFEIRKTPYKLAFKTIDGKDFDSAKLKGDPWLFLYFFTTKAKNSVDEINKVLDVYFEYSRRKIEFVGVCLDPENDRDEVQAFLKKNKVKFPVYFDGEGAKGELCQKFGVGGPNVSFLFNEKGMLAPTGIKYGDLKKYIRP